jgi:hypothetical protein
MEKRLNLINLRWIQIKTTRRYQLMPEGMVFIKKIKDNKCWRGGRERIFAHY